MNTRRRVTGWSGGLILAGFAALLIPALLDTGHEERDEEGVSRHFLSRGVEETGATNIVSAVLLDYRAFDTLGEVSVIFASAAVVTLLLAGYKAPARKAPLSPLVRCTMQYLGPLFWVFPVALILQGHLSPGGGFQGGVALAVLLILVIIVYGDTSDAPGVGTRTLGTVEALCALGFVLLGTAGLFASSGYLANLAAGFQAGSPAALASAGIIPLLNVLIGCKVAAALTSMFRHMAGEPKESA